MKNSLKTKISLSQKLIIVVIIAFVIPSFILLKWLYATSKEIAYKESKEYLASNLKSTASSFDEILRNVDFVHTQVATDLEFLKKNEQLLPLKQRKDYADHEIQSSILKSLNKYYITNNYLSSLYLYNTYGDVLYVYSMDYTKNNIVNNVSKQDWAEEYDYVFQVNKDWNIVNQFQTKAKQFSSVTTPNVFTANEHPLYLAVNVDFTLLQNRLTSVFEDGEIGLSVIDSKGSRVPIYQLEKEEELRDKFLKMESIGNTGHKIVSLDGMEYVVTYYTASYSKLTYMAYAPVHLISSTTEVIGKFEQYYLLTLLFIFGVLFACIVFKILVPIRHLYRGMESVSKEDLDVKIKVPRGGDEMTYICKEFNQMTHNLDALIHENYENTILKKEFELKYIQTQIDEHFLYNTIDCVHWIAKEHNVKDISDMMISLSKYFRLTLNQGSDTITPIQINNLFTQYVYLLNMRQDNPIFYVCTIDERLNDIRLLKYLFQPIFENAILHGLKQGRCGDRVDVEFTMPRKDIIRFLVRDNGTGITKERLQEVRAAISHLEKPTMKKPVADENRFFALANVNQQIQLYYGQKDQIVIESELGHGSTVYFDIQMEGIIDGI